MAAPNMARWQGAVQYRHACVLCEESKQVAVIKRRGKEPMRICKDCYRDYPKDWRKLP